MEFEKQPLCVYALCVRVYVSVIFSVRVVNICNWLNKQTGRTLWTERSAISGLSVLRRSERRYVKIPGLDDLQHQQSKILVHAACCDSWKSLFLAAQKLLRNISVEPWHQTLAEKLQMRLVCANFVPHLLAYDQKKNRIENRQALVASANSHEKFLNKVITELDVLE